MSSNKPTFDDVEYTRINLEQPLEGNMNAAYHHQSSDEDTTDDRDRLLAGGRGASSAGGRDEGSAPKTGPSPITWAYYQDLFDVDTNQVLYRLLGAIVPHPRVNFIRQTLQPKADLYGPLWVSTTLVFAIAIGGNLVNYMQFSGQGRWLYDFRKVTLAATAIYCYWWLLPVLTWLYLRWRGNQLEYRFVDLLALFGYSLTVYIPASLLWMIQVNWVQWLVVLISMLLSASVIGITFLPIFTEVGDKKSGLMIVSVVGVLHLALAMGFMLYFFHVPHHVPLTPSNVSTTATVISTTATTTNITNTVTKI